MCWRRQLFVVPKRWAVNQTSHECLVANEKNCDYWHSKEMCWEDGTCHPPSNCTQCIKESTKETLSWVDHTNHKCVIPSPSTCNDDTQKKYCETNHDCQPMYDCLGCTDLRAVSEKQHKCVRALETELRRDLSYTGHACCTADNVKCQKVNGKTHSD